MSAPNLKIARNLRLPLDVITQCIAIVARRGAGKTYTGMKLAEQMLEQGQQLVVLDPVGVWWGLREGYPIGILGGKHADIPLSAKAGAAVADLVVEQGVSLIIDLSELGENAMRGFVAAFGDRLYRINRDPIMVMVDEADEFAPQQAKFGGELGKCLNAMERLSRRGRARGIGVTLITQRSAVLNKNVLNQTEVLIAMQTSAPQDLKAIEGWIQYHGTKDEQRQILETLPGLQQGEAWFYSPAGVPGAGGRGMSILAPEVSHWQRVRLSTIAVLVVIEPGPLDRTGVNDALRERGTELHRQSLRGTPATWQRRCLAACDRVLENWERAGRDAIKGDG